MKSAQGSSEKRRASSRGQTDERKQPMASPYQNDGRLKSASIDFKKYKQPAKIPVRASPEKVLKADVSANPKADIIEIRDILCLKRPGENGSQSFQDVMRKVGDMVEEN